VVIRERVGITPLEDKLRETRLRWFRHFRRRSVSATVRRCEAINFVQYKIGGEVHRRRVGTRPLEAI